MELAFKSYRVLLSEKLEERCARNSRYSLRSFARDLGISPARLSDVLRGRYGLSIESAKVIADKMGLNESEISHFCDLVASEHSRSQKKRLAAKERIEKQIPDHQRLSMDAFQIVSDWYHFAILELTQVKGFKSSTKWIASRLELDEQKVITAIERMKRLNLIQKVGRTLKPVEDFTTSPDGVSSAAIKKFHGQVLEKAANAIHAQSIDERDFSSVMMAIDPKDIPEAKKEIKAFRRNLSARFAKGKNKTSVYCLSVQLFNLSEDKK